MKRLQVMVPDEVYESILREAERKEWTVADLVRRGIERQLATAVDAPRREPTITTVRLGVPKIPVSEWREAANDRDSPE